MVVDEATTIVVDDLPLSKISLFSNDDIVLLCDLCLITNEEDGVQSKLSHTFFNFSQELSSK